MTMRLYATAVRIDPVGDLPEGSDVLLIDDHGDIHETKTRSKPWKLGHGDWVVSVEGKSGGYDLERIRKVIK